MEADIDNDITQLEEVMSQLTEQARTASGTSQRIIFILQLVVVLFGFISCCIKSKASTPEVEMEKPRL